jgi:transcriptional regulator with XRE-family HTH domain
MLNRVTSAQVRAGRALLAWTVRDLAERSGVHRNTITNFETGKRTSDPHKLDALVRALEAAGVEFTNGDAPGVRLRRERETEGIRPDELTADNDDGASR